MKRTSDRLLLLGALTMALATTGCAGGGANVPDTINERAKTLVVRSNLLVVQKAAEKYFKDHTYMYPTAIDDDFKSYFEGGDPATKKPGNPPINPFTGNPEFPVLGTVTDLAQARQAPPSDLKRGVIEYSPLENGKSYGIRGGDEKDKAMHSEDAAQMGTLIISRDTWKPSD
ncbi:hypothetical protein KF707_22305 [Candidatus Obscuribacterales bacterium]|nr:hypothetical protein [Candidatus Obscuribacterales bacterium]MBX3149652.1 hypothetical protein [Candidatus Obscuribacterales bacterium]